MQTDTLAPEDEVLEFSIDELFETWRSFPKEGPGPDWENPRQVQTVSLGWFGPNPKNYRGDYEGLVELAANLETDEQHDPIELIRRPEPIVWSGHRRCLGAIYNYLLKRKRGENPAIPTSECILVVKEISELDFRIGSMTRNSYRRDPKPTDEALEFRAIMTEFGLTEEDLALKRGSREALAQNLAHVKSRLTLLNLSTKADGFPLFENVARGSINLGDALEYAKLPKPQQAEVARMRLTGRLLQEKVRQILGRPQRGMAVREVSAHNGEANGTTGGGTSLGDIFRRHGETVAQERPTVRTFSLGAGVDVTVQTTSTTAAISINRTGESLTEVLPDAIVAIGNFLKTHPVVPARESVPAETNGQHVTV